MTTIVLGERVRTLRHRRGMTQRELAACIGMHPINLCNMECGRNQGVRPDRLVQLAQTLNVSIDFLLGLINEPRPLRPEERPRKLPSVVA
jgi:transcriptional regulator with XRE-family HTH domain